MVLSFEVAGNLLETISPLCPSYRIGVHCVKAGWGRLHHLEVYLDYRRRGRRNNYDYMFQNNNTTQLVGIETKTTKQLVAERRLELRKTI